MTNEELAAAIQSGDESKLLQLWEQVERFVHLKAYRYRVAFGLDPTLQDDLYQSGFLAVYDAAHTYDRESGAGFLTWLSLYLKTAFREVLGIRSTRQQNDPIHRAVSLDAPLSDAEDTGTLCDLLPAPDTWQSVEDRIWQEQAHTVLETALEKLPQGQAEVLRRRYYQEQPIKAIAAEMKTTCETVRSQEEKAMRILRNGRIYLSLRALVEESTPYYTRVGVKQFNATGESAVEIAVLKRERIFEEMAAKADC